MLSMLLHRSREATVSDSHTSIEPAATAAPSALGKAWQTLVLALLGIFILLGVGFAGLPQIHDAAHDTRHSFNFPCH